VVLLEALVVVVEALLVVVAALETLLRLLFHKEILVVAYPPVDQTVVAEEAVLAQQEAMLEHLLAMQVETAA
jgi:hypothetical protein